MALVKAYLASIVKYAIRDRPVKYVSVKYAGWLIPPKENRHRGRHRERHRAYPTLVDDTGEAR